jgi:hypothetical protein
MAKRSTKPAPKKTASSHDGPHERTGITGVIILAMVACFLGVNLGIIQLVFKPVETVNVMPKEDQMKPQTVYYVPGVDRGSANWKGLETAFLGEDAINIAISESDFNTWSRNTFRFTPPAANERQGASTLIPGSPNFRIHDDQLTLGITFRAGGGGNTTDITAQVTGVFQPVGGRPVFLPDEIYLGSARLPPGYRGLIYYALLGLFQQSEAFEPYETAWKSLNQATIADRQVILERR